MERGSDRLAFITGQARDLPSDPYPDSPLSSTASPQLSEGFVSTEKFNKFQKSEPSDLLPEIQPTVEPREPKPRHQTHHSEGDLLRVFNTSSTVHEIQPVNEPLLRSRDDGTLGKKTSYDGAASVQPRREMEARPRTVPPNQSNQSDNSAWSLETLKELVDFSPQEISQAISATEYSRFLASIAIAFLVVLSNWGLDVGGIITRVLVGTRPLLFLIITHITIVMTFLMENKDPNVRGRPAGSSNFGSVDSLLMLEIGFLLQKALLALLMDCSVCTVIMICFLGF